MKTLSVLLILSFCIIELVAQTIISEKTYQLERSTTFFGNRISSTSDGGFIMTSTILFPDTVPIFKDTLSEALVKLNKNLELEWITYKIKGRWMHSGLAFENHNNEFVYAGQLGYDVSTNLYIFKCNRNGEIIYELDEDKMKSPNTQYGPIVLCKDESFLMVSWKSIPGKINIWMKKYDPEGNLLWVSYLDSLDESIYSGIEMRSGIETEDKGFIIGGSYIKGKNYDAFLLKIDSSGRELWKEMYLKSERQHIYDVIEDANGNFLMIGLYWSGVNNGSLFIRKTNSIGKEIWEKIFHPTGLTEGSRIIQTYDGGYVVVGRTYYKPGPEEPEELFYHYILKLNKDGEKEWEKYWGIADVNNVLGDVIERDNKNLVVIGSQDYKKLYIAEITNNSLKGNEDVKIDENKLYVSPSVLSSSFDIHISFTLSKPSRIEFFIYDNLGSLIDVTLPVFYNNGENHIKYSIKSDLPSGIYWLKMVIDGRNSEIKPFFVIR